MTCKIQTHTHARFKDIMFKDMPVQLAGMVNLHHKNVSVFNNNSRSCKERTQHLAAGNFEQPNGSMLPICLK